MTSARQPALTATHGDERSTGWAALVTAALFACVVALTAIAGVPIGGAPEALVAQFAAHRTAVLASIYLSALGWGGTLLVFAAGLRRVLRRAEGGSSVAADVAFGACLATAAAILVALIPLAVVALRAPDIERTTAAALYDAANVANLMPAFPNAIYALAAARVVRRTQVMPRAVAWGATGVALIHLASAMSFARGGAFAPSGVLPTIAPLSHGAWLALVAWVLLRRRVS